MYYMYYTGTLLYGETSEKKIRNGKIEQNGQNLGSHALTLITTKKNQNCVYFFRKLFITHTRYVINQSRSTNNKN